MIRKYNFGQPPADVAGKVEWIIRALRQIETFSNEPTAFTVADNFEVTDYTAERALSGDLGAQTTDEALQSVLNVVATFLSDLKKRGPKRA